MKNWRERAKQEAEALKAEPWWHKAISNAANRNLKRRLEAIEARLDALEAREAGRHGLPIL